MIQLKTILQSKKFYFVIIIFTIIYVIFSTKIIHYKSLYNINTKEFIGTITKIKETDYGFSLTLKAKEKLIVYTNTNNYHLGDLVYIQGDLSKPSNNTVLNNFNYKEYLYQNKIYYILNAKDIKVLKENQNVIYKLKNKLIEYLDTFKSNIFLKSFILGDTSYLGNNIYKSYQINGICHLLAVGSTHITLFSIIFLFLLKKLKVKEIISYLILFIIIFGYLLLTDLQISIVRVYLYLILSFLSKKLKLFLKPINLFIITSFITLLINPFWIYHRGFLYSYSISFILILNKDKLTGNYFLKIFKISLISFIYSIPFNIYFDYSINFLGIIYNLIYVPCFNIIVFPLAILTLIFPFFDNLFFKFMNVLNNLSYFLNNFTFGIIILKKISVVILILYLIIFTYLIKELFAKKIKMLIILFIILTLHVHINSIIKEDFWIVIDVSQGDSSLLHIDNKNILIDTGGLYNKDNIKKTITMLHSLGISKIDFLLLTHADFDHMGDSLSLVNNFKVDKVIFNNDDYSNLEIKLIQELKKKKIKYYKNIKELNINKIKLKFLNTTIYDNENDNSLVVYFNYNNYQFLFMGDASFKREKDILDKYYLRNIDFLKVGHHGSDTSSSKYFIEKINPKYSIISVGKDNRYGHPKKEVLETLKNSKIYRTDLNGSIIFKFKNNKLDIKTCSP